MDLQFSSNLRLGIEHKENPALTIGLPPNYTSEYENHVLRFEKYVSLPPDLRVIRDKLRKQAMHDNKKAQEMKEEEFLNPWIITDLDLVYGGNPFVK